VIGIDIGKNSFHIVGLDKRGAIILRQKWSRGQVEARFVNISPCLALKFSSQKGVDFCGKESVTVAVPGRAVGLIRDPAPLAMLPLRGFGGDGGGAIATEKGSEHAAQQNPHKGQIGPRQRRRKRAREASEQARGLDPQRNEARGCPCFAPATQGNNHCRHHEGNRLAAALGPRLLCLSWCAGGRAGCS
jgi:hypothetical protein